MIETLFEIFPVGEHFQNIFKSDGLMARCMRGGMVLAAGTAVERGARFARNMILARILAPDQFGLMAIVLAVNQLFEALTEVGVRQSVVQNKRGDTDPFLNVAWWFSAVRGLALYGVATALSPWFCSFYGEAKLLPLLRVAFLGMVFHGFTSPRIYVLEKHLQFGRYVLIMQGSGLAGTAISLGMVFFFPNLWALVIGFVAEFAIRFIGSFALCPVRLSIRFDRHCAEELFSFARGMAGLPILTLVAMQADIFVLGKVCSKEVLGLYALALALASMPRMVYSRAIQPMILPVLSESQDDAERLRSTLLLMTRVLCCFGVPVVACFATFGGPILTVVYGAKYATMSVAFGLLSVYFFVYMMGTLVATVYLAVGKPELHRRFAIVRAILVVVCIYPAARSFGPVGVASALLACLMLANVAQLLNVRRLLEMPIRSYAAAVSGGLAPVGLVLVPGLMTHLVWNGTRTEQLLLGVCMCILAWTVGIWHLWAKGMLRFRSGASDVGVS